MNTGTPNVDIHFYVATVSDPGCLPDSDTPPTAWREPTAAWNSLIEELQLRAADAEVTLSEDLGSPIRSLRVMAATPAHNHYGTVQAVDPGTDNHVIDLSVTPLSFRDWLERFKVTDLMTAYEDAVNAYLDDGGLHGMSTEDLLGLADYRAALDAFVIKAHVVFEGNWSTASLADIWDRWPISDWSDTDEIADSIVDLLYESDVD